MSKFLLATNNLDKIKEFKDILGDSIDFITLVDLNDKVEVEETGSSFLENALIKAKYYQNKYQMPTISDDSGLVVKSLAGNPGIYSKRYSGLGYKENNQLVLKNMQGIFDRDAYFISLIVLYYNKDEYYSFEGILNGTIDFTEKGNNGFGYDPIFYLKEFDKTVAELDQKIKNNISHRRMAINKLKEKLNETIDNK